MTDALPLGDLVALLGTAAAVTGRSFDDPLLEVEAAKLAAAALQARDLPRWLNLMRNRPTGNAEEDAGRMLCQVYTVNKITGVDLVRTEANDGTKTSGKALIKATRVDKESGEVRAEKPMTTDFLSDPIAKECAGRAKALIGHPALIYRHNEPAPKGYKVDGEPVKEFRRIIWIDPTDDAGAAALARREATQRPAEHPVVETLNEAVGIARDYTATQPTDEPPPPHPPPTEPPAGRDDTPAPIEETASSPPVEEPPPVAPPVEEPTEPTQPTLEPVDEQPPAVTNLDFRRKVVAPLPPATWLDPTKEIPAETLRAFKSWFAEQGGAGQAVIRNENKRRGRPVAMISDPETIGDLYLIAEYAALLAA